MNFFNGGSSNVEFDSVLSDVSKNTNSIVLCWIIVNRLPHLYSEISDLLKISGNTWNYLVDPRSTTELFKLVLNRPGPWNGMDEATARMKLTAWALKHGILEP
jgi:hypothetical protein